MNGATVRDSNGNVVGNGSVALNALDLIPVAVSGNDQYAISGNGSLSFYGPSEVTLGASGDWQNYTATVTGNVSITLTTDGLTLNGQTLAAGTYTITAPSANPIHWPWY